MLNFVNLTGDDVEAIGARLARKVLASGDAEIVDLRAQRGVGIDAVDELLQLYALKAYGGAEPDEIHLTDSEVRRCRDNAHFFLVVVSGVGDEGSGRRMRVIPQPLEQLQNHDGHLVGIRSARSLVYDLSADGET